MSIFSVRQDLMQTTKCSTISLDDCVRLIKSLVNNYWWELSARFMHNNIPVQPEPSEVVSVESYCLCRGLEYIVHNIHCFWKIRMASVQSVSDSGDWSLPSRIIGSTRGLLTPGTRTGTRDSEVCDSHTTIRPRKLPQCFQSLFSSADRLYKEPHPVTWYICRVLVHCSSSVLPPPLSSLYDPEQRTPRA